MPKRNSSVFLPISVGGRILVGRGAGVVENRISRLSRGRGRACIHDIDYLGFIIVHSLQIFSAISNCTVTPSWTRRAAGRSNRDRYLGAGTETEYYYRFSLLRWCIFVWCVRQFFSTTRRTCYTLYRGRRIMDGRNVLLLWVSSSAFDLIVDFLPVLRRFSTPAFSASLPTRSSRGLFPFWCIRGSALLLFSPCMAVASDTYLSNCPPPITARLCESVVFRTTVRKNNAPSVRSI